MEKKRILFELTHPKHFHQFKPLILHYLHEADIKIVARDKDVVVELLEKSGLPYSIIGAYGESIIKKLFVIPSNILAYFRLIRTYDPDLIVSRFSPFAVLVSKLFRSKTVISPDGELSGLTYDAVIRLSDYIITPKTFREDYGKKHFRVNGLFEGAYLNPDLFTPDLSVISKLGLSESDRFFLLRFVGWNAVHDRGEYGFTERQKEELVKYLEPHGRVLISDENKISGDLQKYRLKTKAGNIHTLLRYAAIYIGDSSTMATEAALLGTPSIRYNSFVGSRDMSNFQLLENEFGLLTNLSDFDQVLKKIEEILDQPDYKTSQLLRSRNYFDQVGEVNTETIKILNDLLY